MIFEQIKSVENLSEIIFEAFGVKLDIAGGWGYDHNSAVIVKSLDMPIEQFLNMFASIRANIEMSLTLEKEDRYGGINVHFIDGEQFEIENKSYDHITYEITAMKESDYAHFIQEYKDNYGKNEAFDLNEHFNKRKECTITLQADFWFEGLEKYYHEE